MKRSRTERAKNKEVSMDVVNPFLPMSGTEDAAGGVESASSRSNKKNATNMFIPGCKEEITGQRLSMSTIKKPGME